MKKLQIILFLSIIISPLSPRAKQYVPSSIKYKLTKVLGTTPDTIVAINFQNLWLSGIYLNSKNQINGFLKLLEKKQKCIKTINLSKLDYLLMGFHNITKNKHKGILVLQGSFNTSKLIGCWSKQSKMTKIFINGISVYQNKSYYLYSPKFGTIVFFDKILSKNIKIGQRGLARGNISFMSSYPWFTVFSNKEEKKSKEKYTKIVGKIQVSNNLVVNGKIKYKQKYDVIPIYKKFYKLKKQAFLKQILSNSSIKISGNNLVFNLNVNSKDFKTILNFIALSLQNKTKHKTHY